MLKKSNKILALAGLVLSLTICGNALSAPLKPKALVQYYIPSQSKMLMNNLRLDFIKKARGLHIKVNTYDALNDAAEQLKQFNHEYKKNVPVIVDLVDNKGVEKFFDRFASSDTPLIFLDESPEHVDLNQGNNTWFLGAHQEEGSQLQAQMLINYLSRHKQDCDKNRNGRLDVICLCGPHHSPITKTHHKIIRQALDGTGLNINFIDDIHGDLSFDQAYTQISKVLTREKADSIDLIVSQNDAMALGAINALIDNTYKEEEEEEEEIKQHFPAVFGIDGTPDALDAMADGMMVGTVKLDTRLICDLAMSIIRGNNSYEQLSKIAGLKVTDHYIYIPYHPLELEN